MNIEGLRYVQAVSRTKSFSAAARAYGVTQPALSHGIARLEEELDVKVFDRSPRGVKPTPHGARVLPLIENILGAVDALVAEAQRLAHPPADTIRLGVSPLIGADLVNRAFQAVLTLDHPRDLVLREACLDTLRSDLGAGRLDIVMAPVVPGMPTFRHRVMASEPLAVISSAEPPTDEPVELESAAGAMFVLGDPDCELTSFTKELFRIHDMPLHTYAGEASGMQSLEEWAAMGVGAAIVPISKITRRHTGCRPLVQAGVPVEIDFEAVWDCDTPLGADLDAFVDALAESDASGGCSQQRLPTAHADQQQAVRPAAAAG
ncbi:LysR family transcriptional regulator [Streptomyces sp. 4F14]|uniref:LysR family transcriptional regulator n=1 Tax=Streptomyces sp. 4F14 TaxID=3394380 RepID=UPI003A856807